jgi:hypothetical protein
MAPPMSTRPPKKQRGSERKEDLVLTPGGRRPSSRVHKVEPGQHAEVQGGHMKVIDTATGNVVADLGPVTQAPVKARSSGGPMKKAGPKPAK